MGATNKYLGVCGSCGIDRAVFDAQTKALAEARRANRALLAQLDDERYQRAQVQERAAILAGVVQKHYDVVAEMGAELAAMTARKDGYRRVARKYREMWLVHFSGALMDQMGIEDPNDPDLKDEIVTRTGYASQARRILKILEARND